MCSVHLRTNLSKKFHTKRTNLLLLPDIVKIVRDEGKINDQFMTRIIN